MPVKKKLLLTGASGFLGYHLLWVAQADWEIYGITNSQTPDFAGAKLLKCDICNYIELGNLVEDIEPDAIIHTAAISDANFCQNNKDLTHAVNVEATENLAGIAADYNVPFAFTSSDLVFDGKKGMYREEDERNPVSLYGEQKVLAEDWVLKIYPPATVFRLPLMFGYPAASSSNYLQKFLAQIKQGERVKLFQDEYRSIGGARSIAQGILQLLSTGSVMHLAGSEKLSRYDFGLKAAKAFNLNEALLESCSQKDVQMAAPRPADVSLDISKALSLGYKPLTADEELQLIAADKYFQ